MDDPSGSRQSSDTVLPRLLIFAFIIVPVFFFFSAAAAKKVANTAPP